MAINRKFCIYYGKNLTHFQLLFVVIGLHCQVKYNVSDCSLVICVSDAKCMDLCGASYFPCYNYQSEAVKNAIAAGKDPSQAIGVPSVMEQIAEVKLLHIPKALTKKVRPT